MKSKYSFVALVTISTLGPLGCDKRDQNKDEPVVAPGNDTPRPAMVTTRPSDSGANTAGTPHYAERPGAATPPAGLATTTAPGTVTSALHAGDDTDKDHDAEAEFKSVPTMKIEGDAELEEVAGGVRIAIEVEHAPAGQKGIHIHQTDNCSDIANKSMGEHFAPTTAKHGLPNAPQHHLGDLGNITVDKDGNGKLEITIAGANLKPNDPLSFVGKSIVIHESNDKGSGASGDSGKPIACAPIRAD